jgi:predicted secreted hydrolase
MVYRLRRRDGTLEPASSGTWVEPDGRTRHLAAAAVTVTPTGGWRSPATHARYPSGWRIALPGEATTLVLDPTVRDQELATRATGVTYWEGSVRVRGTRAGRAVTGAGYVELTGYAGAPALAR